MIEFKEVNNALLIEYEGKLLFKHTKKQPMLFIGTGNDTISAYRGNYIIDDTIDSRLPLTDYRIAEDTLTFTHGEIGLDVHFAVISNRLEIRFSTDADINRFWIRVYANPEEKLYGLGAQASHFNLRGRHFPIWTREAGVGRDKNTLTTYYADLYDKAGGDYHTTYYPEPTFVSTRKYWCHLDSTAYADFSFKPENYHELYVWEVPTRMIISNADTYVDLITDLTDFTGRPPALPEFLHDGMILGVQGGTESVLHYLNKAEAAGVKVSGLWCQDWAGVNYTTFGKRLYWNWVWNQEVYPDLPELIQTLAKKKVAFLTYICPFLLKNETLYIEAEAHGYLALNQQGGVYTVDFGEFYCGIVDLTNPEAFTWYKTVIQRNLIDMGVKGWMADFGEYLPVDCVLANGIDAKKMHNAWPVLWARCNYEAVKERGKLGAVFYFMRAGGHGSQRYATSLWAGDQSVNWDLHDGIPSVIPLALSVGMTGNPFTHSDIGGYTSLHGNIRTKELFDRWLEMSVFSAYMRSHEGNRPAENFQFYNNDNTLDLMTRMTAVRTALKPYIRLLVEEGSKSGLPMQRPLFMHYEDDSRGYDIQNAYLFGRDILVHPVIEPGVTRQKVYLPEDAWIHLWTGEPHHGGEIEVLAPIGSPPVFYRQASAFSTLFETITKHYTVTQR